jgi:hypothetical protein
LVILIFDLDACKKPMVHHAANARQATPGGGAFGVRWKSEAATALWRTTRSLLNIESQSGVALRFAAALQSCVATFG